MQMTKKPPQQLTTVIFVGCGSWSIEFS